MKIQEVICMVFGHQWWYVGVFTRMCHRCDIVQVADQESPHWKMYKFGGKITVCKWRNL